MTRLRSDHLFIRWLLQHLARRRTTRQIGHLTREKARATTTLVGQELADRLAFLDAEIASLEARFR